MTIEEKIQKQIVEKIKQGEKDTVVVLRTVLGELQRISSKEKLSEDKAIKIIKKMAESISEMINIKKEQNKDTSKDKHELEILRTLTPKSMSVEDIILALDPVKNDIKYSENEGPAIGMAMKHIKMNSLIADGKDVKTAVEMIRKI